MFKKFRKVYNLLHLSKIFSKTGLLVLSVFIISGISYALMRPGISMADVLVCELEEHEHSEACYEKTLICTEENHDHTEECYEEVLICEKQIHKHGEECYQKKSDAEAEQEGETVATALSADFAGEDTASLDDTFTQFINTDGIKFKILNEKTQVYEELIDGEKLTVDNTYSVQLAMDFTIPVGGLNKLNTNGMLTCKISDEIVVVSDILNKPIKDTTTGEQCGTYSITKDGVLTIQFSPDFVTENSSREIAGSVFYEGTFTTRNTTITDREETITIGDIEINVGISGRKDALNIDKKVKEYDPGTGKLTWTVEVWSTYDLKQPVVITDELIKNQEYMEFSNLIENISIKGLDNKGYIQTEDKDEVIIGSNYYYLETDKNDKFELTLPPLMAANERYFVTYTVDVKNFDTKDAEIGIDCDNEVTAKSGAQNPVSDTCLYTIKKDTPILWGNKEIVNGYNPDSGVVTYEITVKNTGEKEFIGSTVITDRLYNNGKKTMSYGTNSFVVKDESGKEYYKGESSSDGQYQLIIEDSDNDESENFTITLPPLKGKDATPREYIIQYSVNVDGPADNVPEEIIYYNNMEANSEDQTVTDGQSFKLTNKIDMKKRGELQSDGSILWTIEVNNDFKDIGGMELKDSLGENAYDIICKRKATAESEFIEVNEFKLPYEFQEGDRGYYYITYHTKPDNLEIGNNYITNTVVINTDNAEWGSSTGTVNVINNPIHKKCQGMNQIVKDETGTDIAHIVDWVTTVDVPQQGIPQNTVISDSISSDKMHMTKALFSQIRVDYEGIDQGDTGAYTVYATVYSKGDKLTLDQLAEDDEIHGFTIEFQKSYAYDPDKDTQIKVSYQTYADISRVPENGAGYYDNNTVLQIPGKDDVSSSDQYVFTNSDLLKKLDAAVEGNNGEDTTHISTQLIEGNQLKWEIRVKLQDVIKDGSSVLVDQLPEGVTLVEDNVDMGRIWLSNDDDYIENKKEYIQSIDYNMKTNTVSFALSQEFIKAITQENPPQGFWITYNVKVADVTKTQSYKNIVKIEKDGTLLAQEEQTQTVKNKLVDKTISLATDDNNKAQDEYVRYKVEINKNRADLSKDSQWIEVEDRLTYSLDEYVNEETQYLLLDSESVKVSKCDQEGTITELQPSDYNFQYKEEDKQYVMKLVLPDEEYLILEYRYIVNNSDGGKITLKNDISLPGYSGEDIKEDSETVEFSMFTSGAIATLKGVAFRKVDSNNITKGLGGAQFKLFEWTNTESSQESGEEATDDTEFSFEPVGGSDVVFESDDKGLFILKYPDTDTETGETIDIKANTAYYLKETKTPQGYQVEDYFYFYIYDPKEPTNCVPDGFMDGGYTNDEGKISKVNKFTKSSNYYTIPNLAQGLVVNKVWKDEDGNIVSGTDKPDIRVTLYRKGYPIDDLESSEVSVKINTYNARSDMDQKVKNTLSYTVGKGASLTFDAVEEWEDTNLQYVYVEGKEEPIENYTEELDSDNEKFTRKITISDIKKDTVINLYTEKDKGANVLLQNVQISSPPPEGEPIVPEQLVIGTDLNGSAIINTGVLNQDNNWQLSWSFLPLTGTLEDGRAVKWYYYVRETEVEGYYLASDKGNGAWGYGTVTLVNREGEPQVVLPQTGSIGNTGFTMVGMAVMAVSSSIMLINKKGRKKR